MAEILLKAGTGEIEIVEFMVGKQYYGINVLKVRGIIKIDEITPLPRVGEEIAGLSYVRGDTNLVIDLRSVLHKQKKETYANETGLLCEFNDTIIVFLVDKVEGIRRIMWEEIKQDHLVTDSITIGNVMIDEKIVVLLDFESITLAANIGEGYEKRQAIEDDTRAVERPEHIVFAEDSRAISEMLKCAFSEAGYKNLRMFPNGQEAKEYLMALKNTYGMHTPEKVDLVITDIEMPQLDGYTLTKYIKDDVALHDIPVVLFSSLITEELHHKGVEVGADIQIGKPSMTYLISQINTLFEKKRQKL